mgnify:CR=1 FL=1
MSPFFTRDHARGALGGSNLIVLKNDLCISSSQREGEVPQAVRFACASVVQEGLLIIAGTDFCLKDRTNGRAPSCRAILQNWYKPKLGALSAEPKLEQLDGATAPLAKSLRRDQSPTRGLIIKAISQRSLLIRHDDPDCRECSPLRSPTKANHRRPQS